MAEPWVFEWQVKALAEAEEPGEWERYVAAALAAGQIVPAQVIKDRQGRSVVLGRRADGTIDPTAERTTAWSDVYTKAPGFAWPFYGFEPPAQSPPLGARRARFDPRWLG